MKGEELMKDLNEIRVDAERAIIEIVKKYGKENPYDGTWTLRLNWLKFTVIGTSIDDDEMTKKGYDICVVTYNPRKECIMFLDRNDNSLDASWLDLRELISALSRLEIITERLSDCSIYNI